MPIVQSKRERKKLNGKGKETKMIEEGKLEKRIEEEVI